MAGFQYPEDARGFRERLESRLGEFGLRLAREKTRQIEFGRFARENAHRGGDKPAEFTFLGFTHYGGKSKQGHFKVKRRTSRKKFGQSLRALSEWARQARRKLRKSEFLRQAKARVEGHLNYYAITDNAQRCNSYLYHATHQVHKWLNRKSQRGAYNWTAFTQVLKGVGWPRVRIRKDLSPFRRAEAC